MCRQWRGRGGLRLNCQNTEQSLSQSMKRLESFRRIRFSAAFDDSPNRPRARLTLMRHALPPVEYIVKHATKGIDIGCSSDLPEFDGLLWGAILARSPRGLTR